MKSYNASKLKNKKFNKLYIHALQYMECKGVKKKVMISRVQRKQPLSLVLDCPRAKEFEAVRDFFEDWNSSAMIQVFQLINDDFK